MLKKINSFPIKLPWCLFQKSIGQCPISCQSKTKLIKTFIKVIFSSYSRMNQDKTFWYFINIRCLNIKETIWSLYETFYCKMFWKKRFCVLGFYFCCRFWIFNYCAISLTLGRWHCYSKYNILFINAETIVCLSQVCTLHVIVKNAKMDAIPKVFMY